ncbi:Autoinducer 2 sensor kinase/phosphatase LuxQ [Aquisphaera giovannonii]|uniref:histidine kinase n=1 Tax=Aquisphaera giovannonii TaxID=406548 RepID=A0A5B9W4B7_9BACT|nr:response regulator [Aquisphaera giovannonii]QEH35453.1 Autoinducer 2 sensor kinase/phosphatase LuxQ [Aquisphaera giovannonii]
MNPPKNDPVHCLLVDDLEENLRALEAVLRQEGVVLLKARSGLDALELLLRHDVALALVDVQMPEMDGFELAELMRGAERTRRVPIIFLTAGTADRQRRFRGYEAGAVDFLQKPLDPDILRMKAEVFFDLARQRRELARQRDELKAATEENARLLAESRSYAEALRRADLRKDEFLATLSHELRNPLSALSGALQILNAPALADQHGWALRVIEAQVGNFARLIDDLMDVSRITSGKIRLKTEPTDVRPVLEQAVHSVSPLVKARGHELTVEFGHGDATIEVDRTRLEQMATNLLNNAAKYSEDGGRIALRTALREGRFVLTVQDTGIGFEPERLPAMFDLFTQDDRALAKSEGGLGIGLTLVKSLAELHGGGIAAESPGVGKGSTFTITLPATTSPPPPAAAASPPPANGAGRPARGGGGGGGRDARLRILVVDDNADAAWSLAELLKLDGHDVAIAGDGPSAIDLAAEFLPDVVVLDIGLPRMDGYEVARTLRDDPRHRGVTLIATTGYGQEQDRARTREAGFHHHLVKPIDLTDVASILAGVARTPRDA